MSSLPVPDSPRISAVVLVVATCATEIGPSRNLYSTRDHADDIDAVRQALGVEKVGLWGTSYGTQLSVYTALAGDFYGTKYLATNYGVLLLAWGFAGVLGPQIGSKVFESTGTYQYAFFGSAGLALAALVLLSIVRPPHAAVPAEVRT